MGDVLKVKTVAIGATLTELLTAVANGVTVVQTLQIGNVDGAAAATYDLTLNLEGAGDVDIVKAVNVEAGKSVVQFGGASGKLFMDGSGTADVLKATASAAGDLVATITYIERT